MGFLVALLVYGNIALECAAQKSPSEHLPLFPFVTAETAWKGQPTGWPPLVASAVLVAKGYLVTSFQTMGKAGESLFADPAVYVFDGAAWHKGRFVDWDKETRLALIRADVPGRPIALGGTESAVCITGISDTRPRFVPFTRISFVATSCTFGSILWLGIGDEFCRVAAFGVLPGAISRDGNGRLISVFTRSPPFILLGPNADGIRSFLKQYFDSWGRQVTPKPEF